MRGWLALFIHPSILWVLIQGIAFSLYVRYTPTVNTAIDRAILNLRAAVHGIFLWVQRPWIALQQVEDMTQLTTQLSEALTTLKTATGPVSYPLAAWGDFTLFKSYKPLPVEVLYRTFHLRTNFALLSKGAKDSLYPGLAVISPRGVVGVIADTTAHTSIMYPLFHKDIHVLALLPSQQVLGLTSWKKPVLNRLQLEYVPLYVQVQPGDEVWTAPNSTLFPGGLRVGQVTRVETDFTQGFHEIEVATFSDWHRNEPLFVLLPRRP